MNEIQHIDHNDEPTDRRALRQTIRRLIAEISPESRIASLDEAELFDDDLFQALSDVGALGIDSPLDPESGALADQLAVIEELAQGPTSMAAFLISHYAAVRCIASLGSTARHRGVSEQLLEGLVKASFAMSEPAGGTDIARVMTTRCARSDSGWTLSGQKLWTSGAMLADWLVVLARTSPPSDRAIDGISMFLVPKRAPGVTVSEIRTLGIRGMSTCEVFFDEVQLDQDALLGKEGSGMRQVFATINREGLHAAAACLGAARGALTVANEYAKTREVSGRTIGSFQVPQHWLADAAVAVETSKLHLAEATRRFENSENGAEQAALMAKLVASEAAVSISLRGMQIMGGAGYSRDYAMQRYFRDARLWSFSPLNNEMVRNRLAESLLGLDRSY